MSSNVKYLRLRAEETARPVAASRPRRAAWPPAAACEPANRQNPHGCLRCEVRNFAFCAALNENELAALEAIASTIALEPGQSVFAEGDPAEHVFNVTRGAVRVFKLLPDGRRQITGFMLPGDFLGLSARRGYAHSAEAIGDAELCRFALRDLQALFDRFPKLEKRLLEMAGDELAAAQEQMLLLGRKTPVEKVASFLLDLSRRAERWGQPASPVLLPMSRGDIADYLGLTVETVSRSFTRLKTERVLRLPETTRVVLEDRRHLAELAGG